MSKPIKLYSHVGVPSPKCCTLMALGLTQTMQGPNPPKVAIILEELGLPFGTETLDFADMKKEPYTLVNPNGRITLWESSSIIDYLLETYDKDNKLQYASGHEKFLQKSWMAMQISNQGPYYGQRAWFLFVRKDHSVSLSSVSLTNASALPREGHSIGP
ncbi:MAG: hypothetical protein Q9199_005547 [Rusavskia elegans]